jgi:hypothetical protein
MTFKKSSKDFVFITAGEQSGSEEASRIGSPLMIFGIELLTRSLTSSKI